MGLRAEPDAQALAAGESNNKANLSERLALLFHEPRNGHMHKLEVLSISAGRTLVITPLKPAASNT